MLIEAEKRTLRHSVKIVEALEWSPEKPEMTIVVVVSGNVVDLVSPLARLLMDKFCVIGISPVSVDDLVASVKSFDEPVVLLAQGAVGKLACEASLQATASIKALVLADYAPQPGSVNHRSVKVPALVFHGRESAAETHAQAVLVHEEIPGSQIIELDNCGRLPTKHCPTELSESIRWFLDELGKPFMEFEDFPGSDKEPVDPKAG